MRWTGRRSSSSRGPTLRSSDQSASWRREATTLLTSFGFDGLVVVVE